VIIWGIYVKIFELYTVLGPGVEITRGWRKIDNEELCHLYSTRYYWDDQTKEDERGAGHAVTRQWKGQVGRPRLTFEVLLERILKNWGVRVWIELN
jgi:hypothetical protein